VTLPGDAAFLATPFRLAAWAEKVRDLLDTAGIRR
jgi:hypothetical protein